MTKSRSNPDWDCNCAAGVEQKWGTKNGTEIIAFFSIHFRFASLTRSIYKLSFLPFFVYGRPDTLRKSEMELEGQQFLHDGVANEKDGGPNRTR